MFYSPFEFWLTSFRTGQKLAATWTASSAVVDSRIRTMLHAARDPLHGDYTELSRMVPEKVDAFSQAGTSIFSDFATLQTQTMANWSALSGMMVGGRWANFGDWVTIANRSSRMIERANEAGSKALGPVHRAATGNARRLRRKG